MSAPLGAFVPKPAVNGDMFQARSVIGRPLIVQVIGAEDAIPVPARDGKPATVKGSVTVHVWDLVGGLIGEDPTTKAPVMGAPNTVYCNVRWMAVALVDQLKGYIGAAPMPMKILSQKNKTNEYSSLAPVGIEGPELQQVQAVFAADPTRIDREAAAKAQAAATQAAAPAYQQSGFTPMQVQPSAPAQPAAPAYQQAPNGFGQMSAPAPSAVNGTPQGWQPGGQYPQQAPDMAAAMAAPGQVPAGVPQQLAQAMNQQGVPADQAAYMAQQYAQLPPQAANGMTPGAMVNAGQMTPQQAVQAYQQQSPAQPQFQPPAQGPGIGHVQNTDVQNILAGLAANGQQG